MTVVQGRNRVSSISLAPGAPRSSPYIVTTTNPVIVRTETVAGLAQGDYIVSLVGSYNRNVTDSEGGWYLSLGAGSVAPVVGCVARVKGANNQGLNPVTGVIDGDPVPGTGSGKEHTLAINHTFTHPGGDLTVNICVVSKTVGDETSLWNDILTLEKID